MLAGPDSQLVEDGLALVRQEAWESISPGFYPREEVKAVIVELVHYDPDLQVTEAQAAEIVDQLWTKRLDELAAGSSRHPTDDQRVETAFIRLKESGIVASMNLGADRGDAIHESELLVAESNVGLGYVYFHSQDANRLAYPNATLYIGFDAVIDDPDARDSAALDVARRTVAELESQGLTVEWNGSIESRIALKSIDWRRPLPTLSSGS